MKKKTILGLILLAFCAGCRFYTPAADFYAQKLYPAISSALSWLGSFTRFSLEEIVVLSFAVTFIDLLVKAVKKKEKFFSWLGKTLVVAMWLYVWFYMGWGNNYYRTGLYRRNQIQRVHFEKDAFRQFLQDYTREMNQAAAQAGDYDRDVLEADVRAYYTKTVTAYGYTQLHRWQHVKQPVFNGLFSAVLVHGYMGPFFCESQVNTALLAYEHPYTVAHEMAHLAGVTGEAEASYWGFDYCRRSANPAVKYSGYISVLPYVFSNARDLLTEQEYQAWTDTLSEKVKQDFWHSREYWRGKKVDWIEKAQNAVLNLFLKSNGISQGARDYFGVVGMIITMDAHEGTSQH